MKQGDSLCAGEPVKSIKRLTGTRLPDHLLPRYGRTATLRIVPGPQQNFFSEGSLATLTEAAYTVTPQSDRMGYRLAGLKVVHKGSMQFISDCTAMGALQVPPDGRPILLMADRQTTGGYPKIAVVISADLSLAAQLAPGDSVTFAPCTIAQAQTTLRKHRAQLDAALTSQGTLLPSD